MRRLLVLGVLAGCGRIDFEQHAAGDVTGIPPCTEPWSAPVEIATGLVNPSSPSISADDRELYLGSGGDLYLMTRTSASATFAPPTKLLSPPNSALDEGSPSISSDGLTLYYYAGRNGGAYILHSVRASRSTPFATDDGQVGNGDPEISFDQLSLYAQDYTSPMGRYTRATRTEDFGPFTPFDSVINDGSSNHNPSISTSGRELYFDSDRTGVREILVARRDTASGPFTTVEQLDPPLEGLQPEISIDGRRLYFTRDGGGRRLFVVTRCD